MEIEYNLYTKDSMEDNKSYMSELINKVPTDVSGKWVKKEELYTFAMDVADYVLTKIEKNLNDTNLQANSN